MSRVSEVIAAVRRSHIPRGRLANRHAVSAAERLLAEADRAEAIARARASAARCQSHAASRTEGFKP